MHHGGGGESVVFYIGQMQVFDMIETISPRLLDQRLRNRMMEALEVLALGNAGVKCVGAIDYFEVFFAYLPYRNCEGVPSNSALTAAEWMALNLVQSLMDEACDKSPRNIQDAELILSGWPERIQPAAVAALKMMTDRGRFNEEVEEATPSV